MDINKECEIIRYALKCGCSNCQIIRTEIKKFQVYLNEGVINKFKNIIKRYNIQIVYESKYINIPIECDEVDNYSEVINYAIKNCDYEIDTLQIDKIFNQKLYDNIETRKYSEDIIKLLIDEKEVIEKNFNCNLLSIGYELSEISSSCVRLVDSITRKNNLLAGSLVAQKGNNPPFVYLINGFENTESGIDMDVLKNRLERNILTETNELKGKIRFKHDSVKFLTEYLVNMFNAEYILNNRCKFKKDILGKKIFNESVDILVNSNYSFDYEGVHNSGKFLVKKGVISDFLNNIRTQKIIGGTPGDVNIINMQNEFALGITDMTFNINDCYEVNYDISIEELDIQRTMFDLRTGILSIVCYGHLKGNDKVTHTYNKVIDIIELINCMKPYSGNSQSDSFNIPDVVINI